jgi:hypothetical protein
LFQLEDYEFVVGTYRELLNREPDSEGLESHVQLLRTGVPKINIFLGIMLGKEADQLYHRG